MMMWYLFSDTASSNRSIHDSDFIHTQTHTYCLWWWWWYKLASFRFGVINLVLSGWFRKPYIFTFDICITINNVICVFKLFEWVWLARNRVREKTKHLWITITFICCAFIDSVWLITMGTNWIHKFNTCYLCMNIWQGNTNITAK